jgi:RHS repeat-associated protein
MKNTLILLLFFAGSYIAKAQCPKIYTLGGASFSCPGPTGVTLTLSGSETGVNYQLVFGNTNIGSSKPGTGSAIVWPNLTAAGTYSVVATHGASSCSSQTNFVPITVTDASNSIVFTAFSGACINPSGPGVSIKLSASQTEMTYYLNINTETNGGAKPGTGGVLEWTGLTTPGLYQIIGKTTSNCHTTVSQSVSVVSFSGTFGVIPATVQGCAPASHFTNPITRGYNGLISAVRWRTDKPFQVAGTEFKGMQIYKYDEKYQLKDAVWADPNHTLNTFNYVGNMFRVTGLTYDPNGNIGILKRYNQAGDLVHDFSYTYETNKNKLTSVSGYVSNYNYDALGQMTDEDKITGDDQYVEYDVSGKVTKVFLDAARTVLKVEYIYDDRGFRLAKRNAVTNRKTWYIRDAAGNIMSIYEEDLSNGALTQTEVPVYGSGKLGTLYSQQDASMDYELTDQLGNVRALVRDNINTYTATMEDNDVEGLSNPRVEEMQYFVNLFETEKEDVRMNHTAPIQGVVNTPERSAYLYWQSGVSGNDAADKSIGPGIMLKVNPGDKVGMETWAKFEKKTSYARDLNLLFLSQLLGGDFAGLGGFDGMTAAQTATTMQGALTSAGFLQDGTETTRPFAYLNYILFNQSMQYVGGAAHRVPLEAGFESGEEALPDKHQRVLFDPIEVAQAGYIYVWVSNEGANTKVWFDDLKVTHEGTIVKQATDYGVWGDVIREQKSDETVYRFGYQGQFAEKDEETGWNHFIAREYDPTIGRWMVSDPSRQYWSGYKALGNNPISWYDKDGRYSHFGAWYRSLFQSGTRPFYNALEGEWAIGWTHQSQASGVTFHYMVEDPATVDGLTALWRHPTTRKIWNHPVTRWYIPDFYSIGIGYNGYAGAGGGTSFELNWVLRGPEASLLPIVSVTQSLGVGWDADATLNFQQTNYLGPVEEIRASMIETKLPGVNVFVDGGIYAGPGGSIGINMEIDDNTGALLVSRMGSLGLGIPGGHGSMGVSNTFILHSFSGHGVKKK